MTLREQLAADMAAAIEERGEVFEWNGAEYPCSRRDTPTAMELQESGGDIDHVKYWLTVAKSAFTGAYPQYGDLVNNETHQIKAVNGHKNSSSPVLTLSIGTVDE